MRALVWKDLLEEFRARYAINTLLMFALTTLVMVSFAVGIDTLTPKLHGALLWIIIFFAAMSGLARPFVKEEERGSAHALRLSAAPELIFAGKFFFNLLLAGALTALIWPLYYMMMAPPPVRPGLFLLLLLAGIFCLAAATTILAAIVARAGGENTLLPILSFPLLLPALVMAINGTAAVMNQGSWDEVKQVLLFLTSYGAVLLTASLLLFGYAWND